MGDFYDLDAAAITKKDDCVGASNTLLGYIDRRKPIPDWEEAEGYYQTAIESGGTNECAARSYISKLFLDKGDYENAKIQADELCLACGNGDYGDPYEASVRQAKSDFDAIGDAVVWPCPEMSTSSGAKVLNIFPDIFVFSLDHVCKEVLIIYWVFTFFLR